MTLRSSTRSDQKIRELITQLEDVKARIRATVEAPQSDSQPVAAFAIGGDSGMGSEGATCTALLFTGRRGERGLTTLVRDCGWSRISEGLCYPGSGLVIVEAFF